MELLRSSLMLALVTSSLVPMIVTGQDQWRVKVTTASSIPVGSCGAVKLEVLDARTLQIPRSPNGDLVTIADFDMTVGGGAVAPEYQDAYHLRACSCQGAAVGSNASITATYPASVLPQTMRVPGVSAQGSGTFSIGNPDNKLNPPACVTPSVAPRLASVTAPMKATIGTRATRPPTALGPAPIPIPVPTQVPVAGVPIATAPGAKTPINTTPVSKAPVGGATAPSPLLLPASPILPTSSGTPLSGTPIAPGTTRTAQGAIPTGLKLVPNAPIIASLVWDAMPNAVTYSLRRGVGKAAPVERLSLAASAEKGARDTIPDPRDTYLYSLLVTYADGSFNTSPTVEYVSPPLKNPTGFTARDRGLGNVEFQWQAVGGAVRYRLDGPGMPSTGFFTTGTATNFPKTPAGANSWKLTTLYQGNFADYANPSVASAVVRVLPPHTVPWLSMKNGTGSLETVQMPKNVMGLMGCDNGFSWGYLGPFDASEARWLGSEPCSGTGRGTQIGLQLWLNIWNMPMWGDSVETEAVYGNAIDLGVGRRARCAQGNGNQPPFGLTTTCYATAHGIVPGKAGFNDFNTITNPGEGTGEDFILAMVISKNAEGSTFLVFLRDSLQDETSIFRDGAWVRLKRPFFGRLADQVSLDTEGPKFVPHTCLSCHGGKYNSVTRRVDGASFLPLDPELLAFASPAEQSAQEEKIRKINSIIVTSDPQSAVATYIRGLYGNAVSIPGTRAKADYVPQGWSEQAGFYRTVVKPYCATCHLAAPAFRNFATWGNFKENTALIRATVCKAKTMPHSELQYRAFWTKDTGPIYLPGLLASTLASPDDWPGNTPGAPASCP